MKKTKKLIAALFSVVLICASLAACGSNDPIVGTWKMTKAEAMGQTITLEQYQKQANTKEVPTFEFEGNNTVTAEGLNGQEGGGKWEAKDEEGSYTITDSTSMKITATLKDNELRIKAGGAVLIFEKK